MASIRERSGIAMQSTISKAGRTTIPMPIRDHFQLKPGDKIRYFIHPDGSVHMLKVLPITALQGILKSRVGPATREQMNAAIAERATARYRRFLAQEPE